MALLAPLGSLTILIPFVLVLIFRRNLTSQLRIFRWFVGLSSLSEILVILLSSQHIHTNPLIHIYTVLEFTLLATVIQRSISRIISGKLLVAVLIIFLVFEIINTIFWQPLQDFNNNSITLASFLLILMALLYYYQVIRDLRVDFLAREPMFWIVTGIIFYFAANLFFFLALEYLNNTDNQKLFQEVWIYFHLLPMVIRNLLFSIGLWNTRTK